MIGEDIYYPGNPVTLRKQLQGAFLESTTLGMSAPVTVCPYGAYRYSLPYIADSLKATGPGRPDLVVILAPSHAETPEQVVLPESDLFATPLGVLRVDTDALSTLRETCRFFVDDEISHLQNHSIEVLLPALYYYYGPIPIVPLLVGTLQREQLVPISDALLRLHGERTVQVVVAANLSGFTATAEADATARKMIRLLMTAPGQSVVDNLATFENPPRSTWPLALGHILAGSGTRPHIVSRGTFDTEYEHDVGSVVFSSIAYLRT
jgi:AmmeMemoRadiSam system protein B